MTMTMLEHNGAQDPYIPYGRGGAGNMRRQSSIRDAWYKISSRQDQSPDMTKQDSRTSLSSGSRRRSSTWSTSTAGERKFGWKRLFKRHSVAEADEKIEESE